MVEQQTVEKKKKTKAQKVSMFFAIASYFGTLTMLVLLALNWENREAEKAIYASYAASVVFFTGCGVVLQVIGSINMPDLSIKKRQ